MNKSDVNYNELPLPNRKIFDLIMSETNGNVKAFAAKIGVSQQTLNRLFHKDIRSGKYPTVSEPIKTAIFNAYGYNDIWFYTEDSPAVEALKDRLKDKSSQNYDIVPLIHADSVGGMHSYNTITDEPQFIEGYVPFVNARTGDIAIYQSGDSMLPTIPAGSIMQIREVTNWREYFGYGNIFSLELNDGRRITKEIMKYDDDPANFVWCVSHNPDVANEKLPKSMIHHVWKVINILINKGW